MNKTLELQTESRLIHANLRHMTLQPMTILLWTMSSSCKANSRSADQIHRLVLLSLQEPATESYLQAVEARRPGRPFQEAMRRTDL